MFDVYDLLYSSIINAPVHAQIPARHQYLAYFIMLKKKSASRGGRCSLAWGRTGGL